MEVLFLADNADPAATRVADVLREAEYFIRPARRAAEAEHLLHAGAAEALVADAALMDSDTLTRLRRDRPTQPVLAFLASPSSDRAAELLEAGANDVLNGAMGDREVVARVASALRSSLAASARVVYGPLELDDDVGEARWEGVELRLTRRERQVLHVLAESAGRTVRRDRLYRQVWGYTMARGDRSVDVNVKRLRAKLADIAQGRLEITTQPGVGYRLELRGPVDLLESERATVTSL